MVKVTKEWNVGMNIAGALNLLKLYTTAQSYELFIQI